MDKVGSQPLVASMKIINFKWNANEKEDFIYYQVLYLTGIVYDHQELYFAYN